MTRPLVSVIVPTYNYGRFLTDALRSIEAQGVRDLEIVVVDDGSTDNTPEILAHWQDRRLVTVRQPNAGIAAARTAGLKLARGRFIAWLDADDMWNPHFLERQLAIFAEAPEVDFCFTDFRRSQDRIALPGTQFDIAAGIRELPSRPVRGDPAARVFTADPFTLLTPFRDMPGWLQATVFRREVIEGVRLPPDITTGEDLYLMLQVYARARQGACIDDPLVEVRRHGANSYLSHDQIRTGVLHVVQRAFRTLPFTPAQAAILQRRIGAEFLSRGWRHFWAHEPGAAARYYSRALAWPGSRAGALSHLAMLPFLPLLPRREPPF